jgi:hypothetical protein
MRGVVSLGDVARFRAARERFRTAEATAVQVRS